MNAIFFFQNILIAISMFLLVAIPAVLSFFDVSFAAKGILYIVSFGAVFLVMLVRPLADIFSGQLWIRKLVILRKGFGILSAAIIIGFMIAAIIAPNSTYLASLFTMKFWALNKYAFFAHIGDISGLILLITSNRLSQKLLKQNWKRIQRLSYVYFYAGGIYEAFALGSTFALYALLLITNITVLAWAVKAYNKTTIATA